MFSLLIGVGELSLAMLVSTILDPRPRHTEDNAVLGQVGTGSGDESRTAE